ncbi:MAG: hypothetical protein LBJ57_04740, partial [Prevotellaceae bacterium]|nr:hypothetical protein [Prevotellaceae bacterium]
MNEKIYVGSAYKVENEKGTFYQFAVNRDKVEQLPGVGKNNEVLIAIEPKREVKKENSPTHNVYYGSGEGAHKNREVQLAIAKDKLLTAPANSYGDVKLFAASRSKDRVSADLSSYAVALSEKDEDGKYQFVGRGYDAATKFGETRSVGSARVQEFGSKGEDGKAYYLRLDVAKAQKLDVNEYGDAKLGIIPYAAAVPQADGSVKDEVRYLLAEVGTLAAADAQRAKVEATVSLHVKNMPGMRDDQLTLYDCNVHAAGEDSSIYRLIVRDRNPEAIGRDHADLVVAEDKYTSEMQLLSPEERKAAKDAIATIYVGKGWTNDPAKIKLSAADLTEGGLSRAIEDGHKVKAIAIVKRAPEVVTIDHVRQAQARP